MECNILVRRDFFHIFIHLQYLKSCLSRVINSIFNVKHLNILYLFIKIWILRIQLLNTIFGKLGWGVINNLHENLALSKTKSRIFQMNDRSIGRSAVDLSFHVPVLMTYGCCSRDSNTKPSIWGAKALTNCAIPAIWQYEIARNNKRPMGHIANLRNPSINQ